MERAEPLGCRLVALVSGRRRFLVTLFLIVVAALAIRTTFVLGVTRYDRHFYDAAYYQLEADRVAFGGGFTDPFLPITHPRAPAMPSAQHPPLTVFVLTPVAWATNGNPLAMRFTMVVLGAFTVVLVGLLAREIAGDGVGLLAVGIAAVYPFLWVNDGLIMSETLTALTVAGALLLTYKLVRRPRLLTAAGLGAVCGLATLARAEVVLLAPLLAVWAPPVETPGLLAVRAGDGGHGGGGVGAGDRTMVRLRPGPISRCDLRVDERRDRLGRLELRCRVLRQPDRWDHPHSRAVPSGQPPFWRRFGGGQGLSR